MLDLNLLSNMYYAAPELWYVIGTILAVLLLVIMFEIFKILSLKQKNYFLNRDRERYAETLYASRDGYFAFIYPDQKINDPRKNIVERCSRQLAVIMNLSEGTKSTFEDILKKFYKEDIVKIKKYVSLLKNDGVSFNDEFLLKTANKHIKLVGSRINGIDGNIYCDMIWFRDVSFETERIISLEKEKNKTANELIVLQDMIDNLPFPVWLRDDKLKIINCNKKYAEMVEVATTEEAIKQSLEINTTNGDNEFVTLAKTAHASHHNKNTTVNVVQNGERLVIRAFEAPFHAENSLDKIYSAGTIVNISELDELKRNMKQHQNAQLEILGTLGTAFAVFDQHKKLAFHNKSFEKLWQLDDAWFDKNPVYTDFLDYIREKRLLPEVPDYVMFKNDEQKRFSNLIEPQKDMLHLPNGKTLRRVIAAYPMGGLIFAFEDITDRLATTSAYNSLVNVQKEILHNLFEGVLILGTNGRLAYYNQAYQKLWKTDDAFLKQEPNLDEILDSQKSFIGQTSDWENLKKEIANSLLAVNNKNFKLNRSNDILEVATKTLSDGSLMIAYKKFPQ